MPLVASLSVELRLRIMGWPRLGASPSGEPERREVSSSVLLRLRGGVAAASSSRLSMSMTGLGSLNHEAERGARDGGSREAAG